MSEPSDEQLAVDYLQGDAAAFDRLVERYLPVLYRFLYRFTGSGVDAEDAAQEAFIKVWKNFASFDPNRSFKTWFLTVAKNAALDWSKKRRPKPFSELSNEETATIDDLEDPQPLPDEVAERALAGEELAVAIAELPERSRIALALHYDEGLAFREISEVLGEPLDTVKSRVRRAAAALRVILTERAELHQKYPKIRID